MLKKGDIAAIAVIFAVWSVFAGFSFSKNGEAERAVIYLDGIEYASYEFKKLKEPIYVTVEKYGRNVVEISEKGARVVQSDCPDGFELKEGFISKSNRALICLPNRLIVKIEGGETLDAVTY